MTSFRYYLGLLTADFFFYGIPMSLFLIFIKIMDLQVFESNLAHFSILMLLFGLNLVTFTYFFAIFFSDVNSAFKKAPLIMLFLGVILPFALVFTVLAVEDGETTVSIWGQIVYYTFYTLDPLLTFFMGIMYMISQSFAKPADWSNTGLYIPDLQNSAIMMACQFVFYFTVVLIVDWYRTRVHTRQTGPNPGDATSYAKLAVYNDAMDHAERVKRS